MKIRLLAVLLCALIFSACSQKNEQKAEGKYIIDDLGNKVELNTPPQRVISLAPNITEMIYKFGSQNALVGNTTYCDYPEEAKKITKVGDMLTVDFERIVTLKPDLIFMSVEGNRKDIYDKLIKLGIKVFVSNPRNYEGIKKTYTDIASIFSKTDPAKKETALWDARLAELQQKNKDYTGKKVLFLIEVKPIMAAGPTVFLNEYMRILNFKNVAGDVKLNYPVLNREEVIRMNPDIIVYPDDGVTTLNSFKKSYPEWRNLNAIKNDMVVFADRNLYFRPGPRFIDALENFISNLHPPKGK